MLFFNPFLLLGLAAIAIPIIIHLLNRVSARHIEWGAMQFLVDSLIKRKRRILLEEVLLLTARCLLLALAATALARPFVPAGSRVPWLVVLPTGLLAVVLFGVAVALWQYRKWRLWLAGIGTGVLLLAAAVIVLEHWLNLKRFTGSSARDVVIVVDASLSMELSVDGKPNLERAVEEARKVVENAERGTAFALMAGRTFAEPLIATPINDRREILRALDRIGGPDGNMRVLDVLPAAALALSQGYNPLKQILIITDGQSFGWEVTNPARWVMLSRVFANLPSKPQIIVRKLGVPDHIRNLSVSGISVSRRIVGCDKETAIDINISNTGNEAVTPGVVTLKIGDREFSDHSLGQILPGSTETLVFKHRFSRKGGHTLTARLSVTDDISGDNERDFALNVVDRLKVLVVDRGSGGRFIERPGSFPVMALAPGTGGAEAAQKNGRDVDILVEPALVDSASLIGLRDLDRYSAIILSDQGSLSADSAWRIAKYVEGGGGLLIVPGEQDNRDFLNSWNTTNGIAVLPVPLADRVVLGAEGKSARLAVTTFDHSALTLVSGASRSDISSVETRLYWRVENPVESENLRVCGRFSNGDPFIVEKRVGLGNVILLTVPFDLRSGNLLTRHTFVPLLHELVYHLSAQANVNLDVQSARSLNIPLPAAGEIKLRPASGMFGLTGEYFKGRDLKRKAFTRVDAQVNFDWGNSPPKKNFQADDYSVRWTGTVRAPSSGTYNFHVQADDGIKLWLGDKLLINQWKEQSASWFSASFKMDAGTKYPIKIEYYEAFGGATAKLFWDGPGIEKQAVKTDYLSTDRLDHPGAHQVEEFPVFIEGPTGAEVEGTLTVSDISAVLKVEGRLLTGGYAAKIPDGARKVLEQVVSPAGIVPFSVARHPNESRVEVLGSDDMEFVRKHGDFIEAASYEDVNRVLQGYMIGEELWRYLAFGALILLLVETLLARWIAGGRRIGQERNVEFDATIRPSDSFQGELDKLKRGAGNV